MTPDTSVLVAGFASWHEHHSAAATALRDVDVVIGHVLLETYSVLTRLPAGQRAEPGLVERFLAQFTGTSPLALTGDQTADLVRRCAAAGIDGGATYDALIARTADAHGRVLLTRDQRAARTYAALGTRFELLR